MKKKNYMPPTAAVIDLFQNKGTILAGSSNAKDPGGLGFLSDSSSNSTILVPFVIDDIASDGGSGSDGSHGDFN